MGRGGRYNHLIGRFGRELPSTGFALDIDRIFHALDHFKNSQFTSSFSVLVMAPLNRYGVAYKTAQFLRTQGLTVLQETLAGTGGSQIRLARKRAQESSFGWLVLVGQPRLKPQELMTIRMGKSQRKPLKIQLKDLPTLINNESHGYIRP